MNRKVLSTAVAVALGATAGVANAFDARTTAPQYQVQLAGASASSNLVRNMVIDTVCTGADAIYVYRRAGDVDDWAVSCQVGPGSVPGVSANGNVMIIKRDEGGSGYGVTPVSEAFAVGMMAITSANCTGAPTAKTTGTVANTAYTEVTCGATNVDLVPDGGFSDIEPSKFIGINTPTGFNDYKDLGNMEVRSLAGLVFNAPVTLNLRNALQAVQIDNGDLPASCTVGNETVDCMPSLSANEIRSLYTGAVQNWSQFMVWDSATASYVGLTSHSLVTAPSNTKVHICRRVNGSGTQAQANAIFMNYPCDSTVAKPASQPGNVVLGPLVYNNSGSGDVEKCLDDLNNGTNTANKPVVNVFQAPNNFANRTAFAIGVQSTEKNVGHTKAYRYIKVDGAAPTLEATHAGDYYDFAEQSMQWRNDGTVGTAWTGTWANAVADVETILAFMADNGIDKVELANLNDAYERAPAAGGWNGGWLLNPAAAGATVDVVFDGTNNPTNTMTRAPFGQSPNTCQFPIAIKPVQAGYLAK